MANNVVILPKAKEDLENIFNYISIEILNKEAALNLIGKFEEKFGELSLFPGAYPIVRSKLDRDIILRKCVVDNFIIIYHFQKQQQFINIIRVIYSKMDYFDEL